MAEVVKEVVEVVIVVEAAALAVPAKVAAVGVETAPQPVLLQAALALEDRRCPYPEGLELGHRML